MAMAVGDAVAAAAVEANLLYGVLGGLVGFFLGFLYFIGMIIGVILLVVAFVAFKTNPKLKMFSLVAGVAALVGGFIMTLAGTFSIAAGFTKEEVAKIEPFSGTVISVPRWLGLGQIVSGLKNIEIGTAWNADAVTAATRIAGGVAPAAPTSAGAGGVL